MNPQILHSMPCRNEKSFVCFLSCAGHCYCVSRCEDDILLHASTTHNLEIPPAITEQASCTRGQIFGLQQSSGRHANAQASSDG